MSKVESNFESPEKKPAARRKRVKTLEFDFGIEADRSPAAVPVPPRAEEKKNEVQAKTLDQSTPEIRRSTFRREPDPEVEEAPPFSHPRIASTPIKENIPMTPSKPSPINVKSSIERQSREQRAVGTMLNGVAITFICGIVLVASLAGLGGYVLFKQIRNQSATIALLESNMKERIDTLQTSVDQKDLELVLSQKESNLRLTTLQGDFESYRAKTSQSIAQLASANAKLEQRLVSFRQDFNRQDALLTEYRRNK